MEGSWFSDICSRKLSPVKNLPSLQPTLQEFWERLSYFVPAHEWKWDLQIEAGSPKGSTDSPTACGSSCDRCTFPHTRNSLYMKIGETKSRWQKETTQAFRRHSLICSLHSNNPKWLLICSNNGVLTDLKVEKISLKQPSPRRAYWVTQITILQWCQEESNDEVIGKLQCFSATGNEGAVCWTQVKIWNIDMFGLCKAEISPLGNHSKMVTDIRTEWGCLKMLG